MNSPSTSAIDRTAAESRPVRMLGTTMRTNTCSHDAPRPLAACASVSMSMERRLASIER